MPRLSHQRRHDRRERIADAAMRCFARHGFTATSMAEIINESGLSAGSIYSHFESKAELIRFASTVKLERESRNLMAAVADPSGVTGPRTLLQGVLSAIAAESGDGGLPVQIWAEAARDEELAGVARENLQLLHRMFSSALRSWALLQTRDPEEAAERADAASDSLLALVQGYMVRLMLDPSTDPDELATRVASLVT